MLINSFQFIYTLQDIPEIGWAFDYVSIYLAVFLTLILVDFRQMEKWKKYDESETRTRNHDIMYILKGETPLFQDFDKFRHQASFHLILFKHNIHSVKYDTKEK